MQNISKNITYLESTKSVVAIRYRIDNTPNDVQLNNMIALAENIFEPLRTGLGNKQIRIASFFRCKDLNDLVGGAIKSQHIALNGAAMDIDNDGFKPTNKEIFDYIKDNLEYDQLIAEGMREDNENPEWVHVSWVSKEKNRNQLLLMHKNKYYPYNKNKGLNIKNYLI